MAVWPSMILRRVAGLTFTFGAALSQAGYYWAFSKNWDVNSNQFVLTWMTLWLLMHIHLLIIDSISTVAPLPVMPFFILFWVLVNLAGSIGSVELQAGLYHWGVALPSYEAYSVLVTIWTGGVHDRLYRALSVLLSWWLVANVATSLADLHARHLAFKLSREEHSRSDVETGTAAAEKGNDGPSRKMRPDCTSAGSDGQASTEQAGQRCQQVYPSSLRSYEWLFAALSAS